MELVYLWVEKYKNIEKQGFNFSPRFRCEYDEEKNELNIVDKDETGEFYPKNFFGDNINVTAIVGENGSGKSSIFEIILSDYNNIKTNILMLINENNNLKYISNNIKLETLEKLEDYSLDKVIYFSNSLSSITNKSNIPESIKNHIPKRFEQDLAKLYKELYQDDYFDIYETEFGLFTLNLQEILINNPNTFKKFDKRIFFSKYKYQLDFSLLLNGIKKDKFYFEAIENSKRNKISRLLKFILISRFKSSFIYGEKVDLIIKKNKKIFNKVDFSFEDYLEINNKLNVLTELNEFSEENIKNFIDIFQHKENEIWITKDFYLIEKKEIHPLLESWRFFFYSRINFYKETDELDYLSLSSGEKEYIKLLTTYIYTLINNIEKKEIYLFDEVDLSLHPNWQKKILKDLIYFKKIFNIKEKVHFILSSHSTFLLSDLPKENVIFLEKGKQVYPFEDGKQTFGANIHTLLSHGFFMKDGLMGEFAKEKIDIAIKYLNQTKLSDDEISYCENIISIIGEPIIKRELQKMLDSKRLSEIDLIKKQIAELQQELDKKENKK
ncbi:ATP-binding protein [Aliarcobacter butzleri]|uniref:AAA family ATPase n=1 Tax=Aliarcobacter butzleri TaxID=28197 RepID=UPI001EDA28DC|nr:AAA family ATPase [Aliarcobacter butzleri]MCG3701279.1 ATP-binding protein [Aliarcobacter butzleri]